MNIQLAEGLRDDVRQPFNCTARICKRRERQHSELMKTVASNLQTQADILASDRPGTNIILLRLQAEAKWN